MSKAKTITKAVEQPYPHTTPETQLTWLAEQLGCRREEVIDRAVSRLYHLKYQESCRYNVRWGSAQTQYCPDWAAVQACLAQVPAGIEAIVFRRAPQDDRMNFYQRWLDGQLVFEYQK